ncbi:MAG: sugar transferase [Acidobacteriales bacterium]|nr:sugar transferase [Terriglobales bacterium]
MRTLIERGCAVLVLVAALPVLALLALGVALDSGFPILFRQRRIGRRGHPFELLKLRSMRNGLHGRAITVGGDARVTRLGRILRRYKLDELPQLWNVVRGDMSMVGPRPELPEYVDLADPLWRVVLEVRPGLTDLATLIYRNEEELLAQAPDPLEYYRRVVLPEKLRLNVEYLGARGRFTDTKVLALTVLYSLFPSALSPARIRELILGATCLV